MQEIVEIGRATQDELRDDLRELFQGAIRLTLEMVLEEELKAMVGARRFERVVSRKDHRNGTYLRRLLTSLGQIEVAMPRSRDNGSPADVIGRYQRRSPELDEMMVEAYVSGVSQRKMGDVTEALMGERVGRSTVSRVAKRLDEAVEGLRRAPIEGPHPYLYLDATFLDARWARKVENVSALVAYAVGPEGHRRLLAVTLGAEESQQSWSELLEQLQDRGLGGVELVIADEHAGLAAAVRRFLPEARRQRCTVHLQRNVGARVPHRLRKRVAREVSVIFQTSGLAEAKKLLGRNRPPQHRTARDERPEPRGGVHPEPRKLPPVDLRPLSRSRQQLNVDQHLVIEPGEARRGASFRRRERGAHSPAPGRERRGCGASPVRVSSREETGSRVAPAPSRPAVHVRPSRRFTSY